MVDWMIARVSRDWGGDGGAVKAAGPKSAASGRAADEGIYQKGVRLATGVCVLCVGGGRSHDVRT